MNAKQLIELRKQHGMTQTDLAKKLGISRWTIANYEKGEPIPESKIPVILKVFEGFDYDMIKAQIQSLKTRVQDLEREVAELKGI